MDGGIMMFGLGKNAGVLLAKLSPVAGLIVTIVILQVQQQQQPSNFLTDLWRTLISVVMGVFIALVGVIYRNMNTRADETNKNIEELRKDLKTYVANAEKRIDEAKNEADRRVESAKADAVKRLDDAKLDMRSHFIDMEKDIAGVRVALEQKIPRAEYENRHSDVVKHLDRIENLIINAIGVRSTT
jgi:ElaB/YqjD/DUF883 family membrane-anchored ribosome-binding protein